MNSSSESCSPSFAAPAAVEPIAPADHGLNALARERLADGVDLFIQCSCDLEDLAAPVWLRAHLNQGDLDRLFELQGACDTLRLNSVETAGQPAQYDQSHTSVKSWSVRVNATDFWFYGPLLTDGSVTSASVAIKSLCAALSSPAVPGARGGMGTDGGWYGGVLVHEDVFTELAEFIEALEPAFPEIVARERERQMAQLLADRKAEGAAAASAMSSARRAARV
jgi:hypothetical protein